MLISGLPGNNVNIFLKILLINLSTSIKTSKQINNPSEITKKKRKGLIFRIRFALRRTFFACCCLYCMVKSYAHEFAELQAIVIFTRSQRSNLVHMCSYPFRQHKLKIDPSGRFTFRLPRFGLPGFKLHLRYRIRKIH